MCLIALNQSSNHLDVDALSRAYITNSHAFGILGQCKDTGMALVSKFVGYNPGKLAKEFERISKQSETIAVHLRLQTHGKNDLRNCHPYKVQYKDGRRYFIMHNGIFGNYGTKKDSDTLDFIRKIMVPILRAPTALTKHYILELLDSFCIANYSKIVLFDESNGDWHIFNESAGAQENNIWYSNSGYKAYAGAYRGCYGSSNIYQPAAGKSVKLLSHSGNEWDDDESYWNAYARNNPINDVTEGVFPFFTEEVAFNIVTDPKASDSQIERLINQCMRADAPQYLIDLRPVLLPVDENDYEPPIKQSSSYSSIFHETDPEVLASYETQDWVKGLHKATGTY